MCSASQPSSRAMTDAIRSAKHFLPNKAFPPYPDPYDQISRVSGKWTIHFSSGLHGHGTSAIPGSRGAPSECMHGTNGPSSPSTSSAAWPARVIVRMLTATYGESVISTPMYDRAEPSGPMLNGTTYIVRPRIELRNSFSRRARISAGSCQLLVGPASPSRSEQTNVRSSTRATSPGSDAAQYEPGRLAESSSTNVPASTSCVQSRSYSSWEPSNQWTASGSQRATISSAQRSSFWLRVGGALSVTATKPTPSLPILPEGVESVYRRPPKTAEPSHAHPGTPRTMRVACGFLSNRSSGRAT